MGFKVQGLRCEVSREGFRVLGSEVEGLRLGIPGRSNEDLGFGI